MSFNIIEVAGIITAITVIITGLYKIYSLARKVEEKLESYDKNLEQLNLHLNKMALLDKNMPLVDRLHAGEWYLKHGGNGLGKKVYEQLLKDVDVSHYKSNAFEHDTHSK